MSTGTKIQFVVMNNIRYGECYRRCYDHLSEAEAGMAKWKTEPNGRRGGIFTLHGEWWTPPSERGA
jgi:hypothetical protein